MSASPASPPDRYTNVRNDDPWDNDAICWLLEHPDVDAAFTKIKLFECARRQPVRMKNDLDAVILAAKLCERYGVEQLQVFDPKIGKTVWRLRRTDAEAPDYPDYDAVGPADGFETDADDRAAAERLMRLLGQYEAELLAAGKSKNTVDTYVDRAERFLRRIIEGPRS